MNSLTLSSILLGSRDPQRLRDWYGAFDCTPDEVDFLAGATGGLPRSDNS